MAAPTLALGGRAAPAGAAPRAPRGEAPASLTSLDAASSRAHDVASVDQAIPTVQYGIFCGASSCGYGEALSNVYPAPLTWSTTPQLLGVPTGGNVGWGSAQLQSGIVTVGAITDGVADQGVEDWLQAVYDAPNPTGTAAAWDSLTVHAHVDT
ncbi:MAG: hypothetical protein M0010_19025, partial [Actinomycetota bacterium]|nr:hypothetical protein [Actinomycetota bacterium]